MHLATRRRLTGTVIFVVLALVTVVMLYPFYYMAVSAFRSFQQYEVGHGFSLASWHLLLQTLPVLQELGNSTIVTAGAILLILAVSTTGGYAFAKLRFRGSGAIFLAVLACMMVPMQSILIPEYVNLSDLGMINQYYGAILVYAALGAPFATFLMTTYFHGVPGELVEAAVMDGLSYWQIFWRIMLPMAVPAIVTIAVLQFIQVWDDLLVALLFLQTPAVRTITVGLATLDASRILNVPVLMAGSLVSAAPAAIVYLIFQRYLIQGLTMGIGK
jgi:ABC-type glycerol-3-phosphate transport system permease component